MAPTLYLTYVSPPARSVLMTAKTLDIDLTLKEVNIPAGDTRKPEFLKINPQRTIPTLVDDDGFAIWDSHAINAYLVSKYARDDSLYPNDLKKRALVNQRLHFESGVVFPSLRRVAMPILYDPSKTGLDQAVQVVNEAYSFLETFLDDKEWVTGDTVTIADYSLVTSITSLNIFVPLNSKQFPKVEAWIRRCEGLPEYVVNFEGLEKLKARVEGILKKA